MPQRSKNNDHHTRWHNFHFSGKVIICSVLLGLGLVLVGGLVFAIGLNDDDDDNHKLPQRNEDEMPTKAPSSIVGPTIMGIGGFIVVTGVVMCLFETEVCRKRTADSSPLIGERTDPEAKGSDPVTVPESKSHEKHQHRSHKKSPTRISKGNKKYNSSKDKSKDLSPSSKTPSTSAGTSKQFLSSSDSSFQTPPASFNNTLAMQSNTREENQTSNSLLKSFTSSGKSWNTSTEFQTPAASFKDASSLETSIQTDDSSTTLNNPVMGIGQMINAGFLTPVTPSEDVVNRISSGIQKQKLEESNSSVSDSRILEHSSPEKIKEKKEYSSIHNNDCEKVEEHEFQNNEKEASICAGDGDASLQLQHKASQSEPVGNNKNEIKIEAEKNESVLVVSDCNQNNDLSLSSELKRSVQKVEENDKLFCGNDDGKSLQLLPPSNSDKHNGFVHDNVPKEKTDNASKDEIIDDDHENNYILPSEEKNLNLNDKVKPLSDETLNDGNILQPPKTTNLENFAETESSPSDQMVNSTLQNEDVSHEIENDLKITEEAE